ncbi:MAG: hypothetical protein M5U05_11515 [Anaerolineales bacterium]|nr:hypothetical protein [Anaerolineales bacterium]
MIAFVEGRVIELYSDSLIIGIGGVGLQVYVTAQARSQARPGMRWLCTPTWSCARIC